jgi:hydroxymethylglutaryl-CoA synthase
MKIGIDQINYYVPKHYLDMKDLATARKVDYDKYKIGIGQLKMALIAPFEDIVTMALEASVDIVKGNIDDIDMLLFASESGIDFSKSAGNYVHHLLALKPNVRILELKQACYALTGALHLACDYVANHPTKKALVISSDVAWYGFDTPGETTQGAGAIAMIVSANPKIAVVNKGQFATEDLPDFYRPSYAETPIVDGKLSIRCYNKLLKQVDPAIDYPYTCFHLPFANMANKANQVLQKPMAENKLELLKVISKNVGNIYNGSLYLSLLSILLYGHEDLSGQTIGMFSYGSGAIAEYFSLTMTDQYQRHLQIDEMKAKLENREKVDFETYEQFMNLFVEKEKTSHYQPSDRYLKNHRFIIDQIINGHRLYKKNHQ